MRCVYYGHISTGELHLRPILNIKEKADRERFHQVALESALLVKKHHGSLSGEHGDGRLRGEFIPLMYGDEVYQLMRQLKQCWDPDGIFNMNKIVDAPPMDQSLRYDVDQQYLCDDKDLMCLIEQCNGAGDCRKSNAIGGTMCPAFKVSRDELMTTRARANVLREVLTRGTGSDKADTEALKQMLYSCLACKGCKGECPSNVDMTRIRAQVLQMLYDRHGTPFRSWMVARMAMIERLGHLVYPFYNYFATCRLVVFHHQENRLLCPRACHPHPLRTHHAPTGQKADGSAPHKGAKSTSLPTNSPTCSRPNWGSPLPAYSQRWATKSSSPPCREWPRRHLQRMPPPGQPNTPAKTWSCSVPSSPTTPRWWA